MITAPIYLDHNATAPLCPPARDAVMAAFECIGNPSSVHAAGRAARQMIEAARDQVAAMMDVPASSVAFTSGGTEANNQVVGMFALGHVITSAIEHDSVLAPAALSASHTKITATSAGVLDLAALEAALAARHSGPVLVSVMLANNETGVVQPLADAVALARRFGAMIHTDAVQAAGRLPIGLAALGVDFVTLSAHKIGGPKGAGALISRPGVEARALIRGGGQEMGRRAGTENIAAIAGFGAAAGAIDARLSKVAAMTDLRNDLERRIAEAAPDAIFHGKTSERICNTSCIGMPGVAAETQVMAFDLAGIAISAGSACTSGKVRPSHVLTAMGLDEAMARTAIRVSLGPETLPAEIERFVGVWLDINRRAGRKAA